MITNYALIDHVGSVEDITKIYETVKRYAKTAGFKPNSKQYWTMKATCQAMNPNFKNWDKDKQNKLKKVVRFSKSPTIVYMVCDTIANKNVSNAIWIWESHNIPVAVISEAEGYIPPRTFDEYYYGMEISPARHCALIWAQAIGWSFSAPLIQEGFKGSIAEYTAIPEHDEEQLRINAFIDKKELNTVNESYGAKRFTGSETFVNNFIKVAPESECETFFEHYCWLRGFDKTTEGWVKTHEDRISEFLEPGWKLCPECKSHPIRETSNECPCCKAQFEAVSIDSFWEDSYNDDPEWNYEPTSSSASLPNINNINVTHEELATKNYKQYLSDCMVRDANKFYFPEANEVISNNYSTMTLDDVEVIDNSIINKASMLACDPEGDETIHQLFWKRIIEQEEDELELGRKLAKAILRK